MNINMNTLRIPSSNKLHGINFINEKEVTLEETKRRKKIKEEEKLKSDMFKPCIISLEAKKIK